MGKEVLKEGISLAPKLAPGLAGMATEYYHGIIGVHRTPSKTLGVPLIPKLQVPP